MSKQGIVVAIEKRVASSTAQYSAWRIGLTHDWVQRKSEWGDSQDVTHFLAWQADSLSDAQDVESFFINKGMKGGTGGNLSPNKTVYVYIF